MTLKHRVLKRVYELRNRAEKILELTDELAKAIEYENWNDFLKYLEKIDLYPETAEIAILSGFLREGEETCLTK